MTDYLTRTGDVFEIHHRIVRKRNEARRRAEAAEATIARVRALAEEHPGTAWNSGLNLRQALRDALGGTPTDAPEGADSADDERNRFSGEDARDATEPILRPGAHRAPCVDGDVCGEPSNCPPAGCASSITLRDEEHRLVMCALPDAHDGDHDDRNGVTWTEPILRPTDQRYEPPADDHESGCCR